MAKKYLKRLLQIFVLAIELILIIFLIKVNKDFLIERIPFLNQETTTNIDNLVISAIAAFIWILIEVPSQILIHIIFSIKIYPRAVLLFSLYNEEKLKDNINAMFKFIFSTSCKWGGIKVFK